MEREEDRRSHPRVGFKVPAHIYVGPQRVLHKGYILNLSETGAFLMIDKGVLLGPKLSLQFTIPPDVSCEARGEIVHDMDMGIYQGLGIELDWANQSYIHFLRNLDTATPGDIIHFVRDMKRVLVEA